MAVPETKMARDASSMPVLNPYEKRRQETHRKLRDALDRLGAAKKIRMKGAKRGARYSAS